LFFNWASTWVGDKNDIIKPLYFRNSEVKIILQAPTHQPFISINLLKCLEGRFEKLEVTAKLNYLDEIMRQNIDF